MVGIGLLMGRPGVSVLAAITHLLNIMDCGPLEADILPKAGVTRFSERYHPPAPSAIDRCSTLQGRTFRSLRERG